MTERAPTDPELRQLRAQAARNALLSEVVLLIARTPNLDRLLSGAINRFKWALDFECCRLALVRGDRASYDFQTLLETRPGVEKLTRNGVPIAEGPLGKVIATGRVVLVAGGTPPDEGFGTVLALPLTAFNKVLGSISFATVCENGFTADDIKIAQPFVSHLALAIDRWRQTGELQQANESLVAEKERAEQALANLKEAQANLIQAEKMASLGQLTAGIAHEIKNPLNFVNNFAGLSVELLDELREMTEGALADLDEDNRAQADEVIETLSGNLQKIAEHGRRADNIVKSMLEHSRGIGGERREVDLNALVDEALNLAYHGARAQDQRFNITMERDFDPALTPIELAPQELTRVLLNLFGNAFYATAKRAREADDGSFRPTLIVATRAEDDAVEVKIRDNGTGIPPEIREKLFQPFFTTKPTGEGTGLGLSISYDIITQQHGGTITVDSEPGQFTEFVVRLPRRGLS